MRMQHTGSTGTNGHMKPSVCREDDVSCPMHESTMLAPSKSKPPKAHVVHRMENGKEEKETAGTKMMTPKQTITIYLLAFCRLTILAISLAVGASSTLPKGPSKIPSSASECPACKASDSTEDGSAPPIGISFGGAYLTGVALHLAMLPF